MFFMWKKKKYRVLLEGGNLWIGINNPEKLGYFTTRYVEGRDENEAMERARLLVNSEISATLVLLNDPSDPPTLAVNEVIQILSFDGKPVPGKGFTFFPDTEATCQ
jgi:hypothetical protein